MNPIKSNKQNNEFNQHENTEQKKQDELTKTANKILTNQEANENTRTKKHNIIPIHENKHENDETPCKRDTQLNSVLNKVKDFSLGISNESNVKQKETDQDITNKTEGSYECVGKELDRDSGGYLYNFKVKEEYKGVQPYSEKMRTLNRSLFPAFQENYFALQYTHMNFKFFSQLGYRLANEELTFPDEKIFAHRWAKLQEKHPKLPSFSVISSEGILDDKSYIKAFSDGHLPLSLGSEFIHDHTVHIMAWIVCFEEQCIQSKLDNINHDAIMQDLHLGIEKRAQALIELENQVSLFDKKDKSKWEPLVNILWTTLGFVVDTTAARQQINRVMSQNDPINNLFERNAVSVLELFDHDDDEEDAIDEGPYHPFIYYLEKKYGDVVFREIETIVHLSDKLIRSCSGVDLNDIRLKSANA